MSKIHIIPSEFNQSLELQLAYSIKAGFPSPAEDYQHETLDFNRDLIKHPEATFYGRVDGDSMIDAGINDGDIAIIDRSVEASDGDRQNQQGEWDRDSDFGSPAIPTEKRARQGRSVCQFHQTRF